MFSPSSFGSFRWMFVLLLVCLVAGTHWRGEAATSQPTSSQELKVKRLFSLEVGSRRFDPSGLTFGPKPGVLYTVNDKIRQLKVFQIDVPASSAKQTVLKVKTSLSSSKKVHLPHSKHFPRFRLRTDAEGIVYCDGAYFLASEQLRHVFRIEPKTGRTTQHPMAFQQYQRMTAARFRPVARFSISINAGLEGIACDASRRRLYLIQERQPRMVLVAQMPKVWKDKQPLVLLEHFDLPSLSLPKRVKGTVLPPDFAGASVADGFLYVLYRNARAIMKVDLKTHTLLATKTYIQLEKGLYKTPRPYGLAEGLAVKGRSIWLIYDNNRRRRVKSKDRRPVLVELLRPKGF